MYTTFFTDDDLVREERRHELPERSLRLVFIGIWNQADDAGRVEWDPLVLRPRIVPNDREINEEVFLRIMVALVDEGRVRPYVVGGQQYGVIRNFNPKQVAKPNPKLIWYPPPPWEGGGEGDGEQLELPTSRARDRTREGTREYARSDQQQDQPQDRSTDRRRHTVAGAPGGRAPDDDDLARARLPVEIVASFERAFGRRLGKGEAELLAQLMPQEAAVREILRRVEARTAKGRERPTSIAYITGALRNFQAEAPPADERLAAERAVGRELADPERDARERADEEQRRHAAEFEARLARAKLPPCPRCQGKGCMGWGDFWQCEEGRRTPVEPYQVDIRRDLYPDARWNDAANNSEERGHADNHGG